MQYQSNEEDDLQYRIFGESFNFPVENSGTASRRKKWVCYFLRRKPSQLHSFYLLLVLHWVGT